MKERTISFSFMQIKTFAHIYKKKDCIFVILKPTLSKTMIIADTILWNKMVHLHISINNSRENN
jgi:hypothetical protein